MIPLFITNSGPKPVEIQEQPDRTAPVIRLLGEEKMELMVGTPYVEPGFICIDNRDYNLTDVVAIEGHVDSETPGYYRVTYRVTDNAGNAAKAIRTVTVRPNPEQVTIDRSGHGVPVLMYHFFYDPALGETGPDDNWLEIDLFEQQMQYLHGNKYYFPTWAEVEDFIDGLITLPEKSVVLTIDDGNESFFRLAIPILERYNIPATCFVVTSEVEKATMDAVTSSNILFRNHTHNMHIHGANGQGLFLTIDYEAARRDLGTVYEILGVNEVFCYPYGHYNDFTRSVLTDAGFRMAFTTVYDRVHPHMDKLTLPRIRVSDGESLTSFIEKV